MHDNYDYDDRSEVISATGLLRSIRQIFLPQQNKNLAKTVDVSHLVAYRMGHAIHDGCERAWSNRNNVLEALKLLGAADSVVDNIRVNPEAPEELEDHHLPVYVEQRAEKQVMNMVISGKYDLVLNGIVNDYKSTSVWTYIYDSNKDNYIKQGSIYKWLSPDKITSDIFGSINKDTLILLFFNLFIIPKSFFLFFFKFNPPSVVISFLFSGTIQT